MPKTSSSSPKSSMKTSSTRGRSGSIGPKTRGSNQNTAAKGRSSTPKRGSSNMNKSNSTTSTTKPLLRRSSNIKFANTKGASNKMSTAAAAKKRSVLDSDDDYHYFPEVSSSSSNSDSINNYLNHHDFKYDRYKSLDKITSRFSSNPALAFLFFFISFVIASILAGLFMAFLMLAFGACGIKVSSLVILIITVIVCFFFGACVGSVRRGLATAWGWGPGDEDDINNLPVLIQ